MLFVAGFIPLLGAFLFRYQPYMPPPSELPKSVGGLSLRYGGVCGHEISDGKTVILLDPVVTRPKIWEVILGPLVDDAELAKEIYPRADFILVNHGHYDHAIDAPSIAWRTKAKIIGTQSTCNLALSRGLKPEQCQVVKGGETLTLGTFKVRVGTSLHGPILGVKNPMSGVIKPDAERLWFYQYTQDGTLTFHLDSAGRTIFFHPSSTYLPGETKGFDATTLILGVTGEGLDETKIAAMAADAPNARVILPTHHDNFFQPLSAGMSSFPGVDLEYVRELVRAGWPKATFVIPSHGQSMTLPR